MTQHTLVDFTLNEGFSNNEIVRAIERTFPHNADQFNILTYCNGRGQLLVPDASEADNFVTVMRDIGIFKKIERAVLEPAMH